MNPESKFTSMLFKKVEDSDDDQDLLAYGIVMDNPSPELERLYLN
jgi:hypothetical protein